MKPDVVIATAVLTRADGGERLLQLARRLRRDGTRVEIVALREGTRPDTAAFRSVAPTTVIDRFRRRGPARLPWLLGLGSVTRGVKRVRLRRWMDRRRDATLVVHHPIAAALVRHASQPPRRIVASFPDDTWSMLMLRPEDRDTLAAAAAWLTWSLAQSDEIRATFDGPVVELDPATTTGALVDRDSLPTARRDPDGPVLLVPPTGTWHATDHAVELAWRIRRTRPATTFRWIATAGTDQWLARHDRHHAGLDDAAELVSGDEPGIVDGVSAVVRTGYHPSHGDLVLAAALAGVPVVGTCTSDLPVEADEVARLDVDALADLVVELLDEPDIAACRGDALRTALAHLDRDYHFAAVAELVRPTPS